MRSMIAAIALVFAIVVVMPTEAHARAPRRVEKWGCTFVAKPIWSGPYLDTGIVWEGVGAIHCDQTIRLTVTTSVFQDVPGEPDQLYAQQKWTMPWGPDGGQMLPPGGNCLSDGTPPVDPFYFRMKVERKGPPGVAWVASWNVPTPARQARGPCLVVVSRILRVRLAGRNMAYCPRI